MERLAGRPGVSRVTLGVELALGIAASARGAVGNCVVRAPAFAALRLFGQGSLTLCSASLGAKPTAEVA